MVPSCVIGELDVFKVSQNRRKRTRAREALKLLEKASAKETFALELRADPVELRLRIPLIGKMDWDLYPNLDSSKPDDHLVLEAITYKNGAIVFSHDTGPRIAARRANINAVSPPDGWLLEPEQTDEQKKIKLLENDLVSARQKYPIITADFVDCRNPMEMIIPSLKSLEKSQVVEATSRYLALFPPQNINVSGNQLNNLMMGINNGYTAQDRGRYEDSYETFKRSVFEYFENLHIRIAMANYVQSIRYRIVNDSTISAQGLRIEVEIFGSGLFLFADEEDAVSFVGSLKLPEAPEKRKRCVCPILPKIFLM